MTLGLVLNYTHFTPAIAAGARLAPDSALIGRVRAGPRLTLRSLATLRADGESITVGSNCFFGERATVHIADGLIPTVVGDRVAVGRYALVHACTVGDDCVVGDCAVVMDGAVVGPGSIIAAGALVPPRKTLEGGWLYQGSPAQPVRRVERQELEAAQAALRGDGQHPALREADVPPFDMSAYVPRGVGREPLIGPGGAAPRVHAQAYVAATAVLTGDVVLSQEAGVWFGCALYAGGARIVVGARSNVQDNSLLVTDERRGAIVIGNDVTVGHNVRMGACTIEDECLIGMGSTLEDGVVVERGGCVGARSHVTAGTVVKAGQIWAGRPARRFREVSEAEREAFRRGREVYVAYTRAYRA
ncbi:MAG: gamma carbonic anhydrase family protein [Pseudomonadota bacterium]|jgi:carbonic anhydrase/acetyltransferase-like protein (isoleucine patch superfamily)